MYRDFPSGDFERYLFLAAADGNGDLRSGRAFHPPYHAVLRELDTCDDLVIHLEDAVALLESDFLGRSARNHFQDYGGIVRHVELDADAVEVAGQVGFSLVKLNRRHIDGMRVQGGKGSSDGCVGQILPVYGIDIVLVNLVQDEVQFTPLVVLYVYQVLPLGICVVCERHERSYDDPEECYPYG